MITPMMTMPEFFIQHPYIVIILVVWSLIWKGIALWRAAQLSQRGWFILILIVNALGLLEIIYLLFIARKYKVEVESK